MDSQSEDSQTEMLPQQQEVVQPTQQRSFQTEAAVTPQGWTQPLIYQAVSPRKSMIRVYEKYNSVKSMKLGTVQIVAGIFALIANIAGIVVQAVQDYRSHLHYNEYSGGDRSIQGNYYWEVSYAYYFSSGIWCPIFIFLSGAFARFAAKRKTRCAVITHIVLATLGALFSFTMLGFSVWAAGYDSYRLVRGFNFNVYRENDRYYNNYGRSTTTPWPSTTIRVYADWAAPAAKGSLFLSLILFTASVAAFVASVWAIVLCSKVLCVGLTETEEDISKRLLLAIDQLSGQPQIVILDERGWPLKLERFRWSTGINMMTGEPLTVQQESQAIGPEVGDNQVMGAQFKAPKEGGIPYQALPPPISNMT